MKIVGERQNSITGHYIFIPQHAQQRFCERFSFISSYIEKQVYLAFEKGENISLEEHQKLVDSGKINSKYLRTICKKWKGSKFIFERGRNKIVLKTIL